MAVKTTGGYGRVPSGGANYGGDFTIIFAISTDQTAPGTELALTTLDTGSGSKWELYQLVGTQTFEAFWRDNANAAQTLTTRTSANGTWTHVAFSRSGTTGGKLQAIDQGFNRSSPTYLVNQAITVQSLAAVLELFTYRSGSDTSGGIFGRVIVAEAALSDAQILDQWKSKAPTGAFTVHSHYPMASAATVATDASGNAHNLTLTNSGSFVDWATEPSDWSTTSSSDPGVLGGAQRMLARNTLLRMGSRDSALRAYSFPRRFERRGAIYAPV